MTTDHRDRITSLYHAALERAPAERAAFLDEVCAGDAGLRHEVESLLRVGSEAGPFLETPAINLVPKAAVEMVGRQLGPYRILAPLGAGGMGEVYRARDSKLGREVAIKMLPPHFTTDPERRARFAREARVLATLNHPHIGAIYGLEDAAGESALVLELVEGPTLADRLERGAMPIAEALAAARQIADALEAAHQKNIIHRDLKPANIVLQGGTSSEPRVKVLDFGLATTGLDVTTASEQVSMTAQRTEAGRILGTPAYMSPEQARGQLVDKRTDVWAFGCVLFEMLTGKSVFGGNTVTDTLARILEREPEWTALPAQTSASIRTLLRRCLTKDPANRLHDIADARIEIDDRDQAATPTSQRGPQRARPLLWTAAALMVLVPSAAAIFLWFRAPAPPIASRVAFAIGAPDKGRFASRAGPIALAPDGSYLAAVVTIEDRSQLWVRPIDSLEWRVISGTEDAVFPFWKPDSREIGFFAKGKLRAVPVRAGGIPYVICDAAEDSGFNGGASWNRDDVILFVSPSFALQRVSATSGAVPVALTTLGPGETSHRWPSFLPDGQHFLYLALSQPMAPGELRVGSLDGASPASLGRFQSNARYADGHLLWVSGGQLVVRRFDGSTRLPSGDPVSVAPMAMDPTMAANGLANFSAAESGVVAYLEPPALHQLAWRDRKGAVVGTFGEPLRVSNLDLSPDGTRLALSARRGNQGNWDIWTADLRSGNFDRLTTDPAPEFDPRWSPRDGNSIAFISGRVRGRWSSFRRPSNGSLSDELLVPADSSVYVSDWTPDGEWVLYTNDGEDLFVHPVDGARKPFTLKRTAGRKETPVFSPDGRWIAYVSHKAGRREIYVRAFPSGEVEFKVSRDGGRAPRWSADGSEIFFLSPDATMMAVRVETAKEFKAPSAPEVLFATTLLSNNQYPYAVARDGRFLMPMPVDLRNVPPITVLLNWQTSLPKP